MDNIDKSNDLTAKLREEYAAMSKENEHLQEQNKKLNETVTDLRIRVRNLEQYTRKNNIEISGIPQTPNENSLNLLKDVGRAMGQELVEAQVSAVHRVPTYKADRTPSWSNLREGCSGMLGSQLLKRRKPRRHRRLTLSSLNSKP
ncbi:hypothetical protein J6590_099322 [Homalodisca vitripennis]|nr:hypothetical protein J6590_099322 [Homalodisca vitripennis]